MLINAEDYRTAARRRLPRSVFEVIDAGAGDEVTLRANRRAFDEIVLRPAALAEIDVRDLTTTVLGKQLSMPVLLDPCGYARMAHRDAELAVARAAAAAGTAYAISTISSYPLEEIARAAEGPKWFQLYPPADRDACARLIDRARDAGYVALCVTIDGATAGLRERDRRNRLAVPVRMTPRRALEGLTRPRWTADFLRGGAGRGSQGFPTAQRPQSMQAAARAIAATARAVTADDLRFARQRWDGPLVVKGVQRADEVEQLLDLGADAIVVSNHGGRQLDGVPATIEILPEVVAAVADRAEVLVDGGFRRGTDVVKALALGARAVLVGRPYLYGLAVGGEAGVREVLDLLRFEVDQTLALVGARSPGDVDASAVGLRAGFGTVVSQRVRSGDG